jgi:RNA recognition motif-containing protein
VAITKLFIGNLSFNTTEQELQAEFEKFGVVVKVLIPVDKDTQRPRGFGFVSMLDLDAAQQAVASLEGKSVGGRMIRVDFARPLQPRPQE